jgi:hypothetical protein
VCLAQVAGNYEAKVVLTGTNALIGKLPFTVAPGPVDTGASQIISPRPNSILTAGASLAIRIAPRDAFGNSAAPEPGVRIVAIAEYTSLGARVADAATVANGTRIELALEAGGGAYGPWAGQWAAMAAGDVTLRLELEMTANGTLVAELPPVTLQVRCSHDSLPRSGIS